MLNFVPDPEAGLVELTRVVRPGGTIVACTWDYAVGMRMLAAFWRAAATLDPAAPDEGHQRLRTAESLTALWHGAGLIKIETAPLTVSARYADFDDLWQPLTYEIGPAGAYCAGLDHERQTALRAALFTELESPAGAFSLPARAWAVRGRLPGE
ncbi:methyltransferase domain-containing protein [Microlunatus speluncae]|uniref:methyltransferase domain-containing protein n=1 Tax=Microlunatus speluncae TaxID=2594267 RepID=UPI003CCDD503